MLTGQHSYSAAFMLLQLLFNHVSPFPALLGAHVCKGAIVGLQLARSAYGTM
jgi:hypothetical protein